MGWGAWPGCSCSRLIVVAALAPFQLQLQGIPAVMWPQAGTGGISLDSAPASAIVEPGSSCAGDGWKQGEALLAELLTRAVVFAQLG